MIATSATQPSGTCLRTRACGSPAPTMSSTTRRVPRRSTAWASRLLAAGSRATSRCVLMLAGCRSRASMTHQTCHSAPCTIRIWRWQDAQACRGKAAPLWSLTRTSTISWSSTYSSRVSFQMPRRMTRRPSRYSAPIKVMPSESQCTCMCNKRRACSSMARQRVKMLALQRVRPLCTALARPPARPCAKNFLTPCTSIHLVSASSKPLYSRWCQSCKVANITCALSAMCCLLNTSASRPAGTTCWLHRIH